MIENEKYLGEFNRFKESKLQLTELLGPFIWPCSTQFRDHVLYY